MTQVFKTLPKAMQNVLIATLSTDSLDRSLLSESCTLLTAHVVFGSPHKNCAGSGICKTITPAQQEDWVGPPLLQCDWAPAIIQYRHPEILCFYFPSTALCKKVQMKHFAQNRFVVESAVSFTPTHETRSFKINAGVYPVEKCGPYLKVAFI